MIKKTIFALALTLVLFGCSENTDQYTITASIETEAIRKAKGDSSSEASAIWYNSAEPEMSLVFGTNKASGFEVFSLSGIRRSAYQTGVLNGLDVRYGFPYRGNTLDIMAASNSDINRVEIWGIDPAGEDFSLISTPGQLSNLRGVYALSLFKSLTDNSFYVFVSDKTGQIEQWLLTSETGIVKLKLMRNLQADSEVKAMVTDDETGLLYVAKAGGGISVFEAEPTSSDEPRNINNSGTKFTIEGLTMFYRPNGQGYLIGASAANNRFVVFDREENNDYLGYFMVGDGLIDAAEGSQGISVINLNLGPRFSNGMFVCHDTANMDEEQVKPQNFKFILWEEISKVFNPVLESSASYRSRN